MERIGYMGGGATENPGIKVSQTLASAGRHFHFQSAGKEGENDDQSSGAGVSQWKHKPWWSYLIEAKTMKKTQLQPEKEVKTEKREKCPGFSLLSSKHKPVSLIF